MSRVTAAGGPGDITITSVWFVGAVTVLTVACAVATVMLWDRPRWRTVRRATGLLLTQLMVLLTIGVFVNRQANFFVTVGELFGSGGDDSYAASVPPGTPTLGPGGAGREQFEAWLAAHRQASTPGRGIVAPVVIAGGVTGYRLPARVYVPAAYFDPAQAQRRFPTVLLLAGYPGSVDTWPKSMRIAQALDAAIGAGRMGPVLAVMPEQNPVRGRDSECVDSADGVRADTYLTSDVPAAVAPYLRITGGRTGWAVAGYSTGGYCAVNLALRHPGKFVAAASLSGHFRPLVNRATGALYGNDLALRRANDPRVTVTQPRSVPVDLFLFASTGDREALRDLEQFRPLVRAPDSVTVVADRAGGHNFRAWRAVLPDLLGWLGGRLGAPTS